MGMHHVYLSWVQKHNFMMSVYFKGTFPIKGLGLVIWRDLNLTATGHSDMP